MDQHAHHQSHSSVDTPAHDGREMTHRGDLADPHDIDHQAMTEAEHAAMGNGAHAGHDKHAGHSVEMFRSRFWISFLLSIPVVLYSPMVQEWLRFTPPQKLDRNANGDVVLPHIRFDRALDYLVGDRLA